MNIVKLTSSKLPDQLRDLAQIARAEGFTMVDRLIENYHSGKNRFAKGGEALFFAWDEDMLIGVGGVNVDPYFGDEQIGRVRHFYIHPDRRGEGIGRDLMAHIEQHAVQQFTRLQLFTPTLNAAKFYEALHYAKPQAAIERVSHVKQIEPSL